MSLGSGVIGLAHAPSGERLTCRAEAHQLGIGARPTAVRDESHRAATIYFTAINPAPVGKRGAPILQQILLAILI